MIELPKELAQIIEKAGFIIELKQSDGEVQLRFIYNGQPSVDFSVDVPYSVSMSEKEFLLDLDEQLVDYFDKIKMTEYECVDNETLMKLDLVDFIVDAVNIYVMALLVEEHNKKVENS
jgi:hypothetical protein